MVMNVTINEVNGHIHNHYLERERRLRVRRPGTGQVGSQQSAVRCPSGEFVSGGQLEFAQHR